MLEQQQNMNNTNPSFASTQNSLGQTNNNPLHQNNNNNNFGTLKSPMQTFQENNPTNLNILHGMNDNVMYEILYLRRQVGDLQGTLSKVRADLLASLAEVRINGFVFQVD